MTEMEHMLQSSHSSTHKKHKPLEGFVFKRIEYAIALFKLSYAKDIRLLRVRQVLAEFLATFILVTLGNASFAQFILSKQDHGTFLTVNIGYGIGMMIGGYMAAGISGAHMNPAMTLAMAMRGRVSWIKVIPYWIAQYLGAFLSSAVVYGIYVDAIYNFDGLMPNGTKMANCFVNGTILNPKLPLCTGTIFATYPQHFLSLANGFFDQIFATFLLVVGVFAISDSDNFGVKSNLKPVVNGFLLWGIGGSFGLNCGYAVNPARDFGPRVFSALAGWGTDVFICSKCSVRHWWWVPVIAPMVGAAIAAPLYWFLIEANHPQPQEEEDDEDEKDTDTDEGQ